MPTPFMHLQMAEWIRGDTRLCGRARTLVQQEWPAFYLGSIAPDLNAISDIRRFASHFYHTPPAPGEWGYTGLFASHPHLAESDNLAPDHAIFIAAYSAHLMLDVRWFRQILVPYFFEQGEWQDNKERFLIHNILLTYLDKLAFATLPEDAGQTLAAATPQAWLPFAADELLINWQKTIVSQLYPGATIRTIEIYSGRMGMTPSEFSAHLDDPSWMVANLFERVPITQVQTILQDAIGQSIDLITTYLQNHSV
ncbi:MAG: hypothetical protein KA314_01325 [Chloroflexi bacterium]|nr:hypothetical protein [Chloroflexota bacterium]MBP8054448.1 hypothetical protein [Chloroflexota bacterium]